jgi:transposase
MDSITYVGLDVHKTTISVPVADGGRSGEVRQLGVFANRADVVRKMVERLENRRGRQLRFCYEAGPCGYGLHRFLTGLGHACTVIAPSLIPIKAGDRIKTDRRDAVMLARLHRAGELTGVWVPDAVHEAMRDLVRARATATKVLSDPAGRTAGMLSLNRPEKCVTSRIIAAKESTPKSDSLRVVGTSSSAHQPGLLPRSKCW